MVVSRNWFGGLIAGLAAGQLALTRIDFILLVGPLLLYLAYVALRRRWRPAHWALAGGLGAMLLQALLHIVFIARAYFLDTLYARLQDQSAIVAYLAYLLWTPALRRQFMEIPRSAPLRSPLRLPIELALVAALVVAFVLLRRDGRPQQWIERVVARYRRGLLSLGAAAVLLLGAYGYLIRPQILTAETLAAAPGCLAPAQIRQPSGACLALQGYIGAPIEPPAHPNAIAYLLYAAPKWIRGQAVPPRQAVSISPDRPAEADKIAIAQANLVRVGWYLSPLGVILGILGFALWWRCGLNRASWPFLLVSLLSAFFFVRLAYGSSDLTYIYILRRYMPLVYPALSLGMAYALVALARRTTDDGRRTTDDGRPTTDDRRRTTDDGRPTMDDRRRMTDNHGRRWSFVFRLLSFVCAVALLAFLAATGWPLYRHVEYAGALDQLATVAGGFEPQDVLLFRGEGRDTPDLMVTPLKYAFDRNAFAIRSADPGKYAAELARYVRRWQSQGRQVYLVLGPNGAVELPGMRPVRVGPASLRLPEYQQLRDQKPRGTQEFGFDFSVYRLDPADGAAPAAALPIGVDDYTAQLRGFYHPEQIGGRPIAWTDGDALLRLPWPKGDTPQALTVSLSPGASRPASLGPARVCLSYRPEASFAFDDRPFSAEQCFELRGPDMAGYRFAIDPRGQPAPPTGTLLLRIASDRWVPAEHDKAQHDERSLGVQFGGVMLEG